MRKYSVDQMEADLEELVNSDLSDLDMELVTGEPADNDILLNSCGILATNPEQVTEVKCFRETTYYQCIYILLFSLLYLHIVVLRTVAVVCHGQVRRQVS